MFVHPFSKCSTSKDSESKIACTEIPRCSPNAAQVMSGSDLIVSSVLLLNRIESPLMKCKACSPPDDLLLKKDGVFQ